MCKDVIKDSSDRSNSPIRILTIGYGYRLIKILWNPVANETGFQINHIPHPSLFPGDFPNELEDIETSELHYMFSEPIKQPAKPDISFLESLEENEKFTIHNVILADEHLAKLPYAESIAYIGMASKQIQRILGFYRPNVALSGFEGWHNSLAMLICKKMGVHWYGIVYTPIPKGLFGFSSTNNSSQTRAFGRLENKVVEELARTSLVAFSEGAEKVFVPHVEDSLLNLLRLMPNRLRNLKNKFRIIVSGKFDRFTHRSFRESFSDYVGRIWNAFSSRKMPMLREPPECEYSFFALHMQPEMGIDVWAPYYSNQLWVVNVIARSLPPTQKLLVKLHKIDIGRWNYSELMRLKSIPAVVLVHDSANATEFIKNANIVFSIQGTVAYEAAMLGRKVITFGETMYQDFPNVYKVGVLEELPSLVREILGIDNPAPEKVQQGLTKLLSRFRPGVFNNWALAPSTDQIKNFSRHIESMAEQITENRVAK
ncbi:MAG: hypothetical protein RL839_00675 [Gammaproteobacteria bacterium]